MSGSQIGREQGRRWKTPKRKTTPFLKVGREREIIRCLMIVRRKNNALWLEKQYGKRKEGKRYNQKTDGTNAEEEVPPDELAKKDDRITNSDLDKNSLLYSTLFFSRVK